MKILINSFCVFYEWYKKRYPKVVDPFEYACFYVFLLIMFPTFMAIKLITNIGNFDIRMSVSGLYAKIMIVFICGLLWIVVKFIFGKGKYLQYINDYKQLSKSKRRRTKLTVWTILVLEMAILWAIQFSGGL
jgi:hypothetical protein